jgi:hypothetical protein
VEVLLEHVAEQREAAEVEAEEEAITVTVDLGKVVGGGELEAGGYGAVAKVQSQRRDFSRARVAEVEVLVGIGEGHRCVEAQEGIEDWGICCVREEGESCARVEDGATSAVLTCPMTIWVLS